MKHVDIFLQEPAPDEAAILIAPIPFDHWGQRSKLTDLTGLKNQTELKAANSGQKAVIAKPIDQHLPALSYALEETNIAPAPFVWNVPENQYTRADNSLTELAIDLVKNLTTETAKIFALIEYASDMFGYGHTEGRFYQGLESVPAVCGTTKGSCVDINTFLLAAALSLDIKGQYIAGYWFHPDKTETLDMHCWLAFEADNEVLFWDLAHHLKWGVEKLAPGLNPAGGRRIAMSCGRGLEFETINGRVSISHFSEPVWIMPDGKLIEPSIRAKITD